MASVVERGRTPPASNVNTNNSKEASGSSKSDDSPPGANAKR